VYFISSKLILSGREDNLEMSNSPPPKMRKEDDPTNSVEESVQKCPDEDIGGISERLKWLCRSCPNIRDKSDNDLYRQEMMNVDEDQIPLQRPLEDTAASIPKTASTSVIVLIS